MPMPMPECIGSMRAHGHRTIVDKVNTRVLHHFIWVLTFCFRDLQRWQASVVLGRFAAREKLGLPSVLLLWKPSSATSMPIR